jgi:hypothetical protein
MSKTKDQILLENLYEKVIEEAKKKINPWAVAKSIAKKKHLGPKKEEEIVKGVKKNAKKYGKKITSDKINESYEDRDEESQDEISISNMSLEDVIDSLNLTPEEGEKTREYYASLSSNKKEEYLNDLRDLVKEKNSKYIE